MIEYYEAECVPDELLIVRKRGRAMFVIYCPECLKRCKVYRLGRLVRCKKCKTRYRVVPNRREP